MSTSVLRIPVRQDESLEIRFQSPQEILEYIKAHPNSNIAIEIIESWIVDEANAFNHIDLSTEFERMRSENTIKNITVQRAIDAWLMKNNKVAADITLASQAYRKRFRQLEKIRKAKLIPRLFMRLGIAIQAILGGMSSVIEEIESISIESVLAKAELEELLKKKHEIHERTDEFLILASTDRRNIIEEAQAKALRITQEAYEKARDMIMAAEIKINHLNKLAKTEQTDIRKQIAELTSRKDQLLEQNPELAVILKPSENESLKKLEECLNIFYQQIEKRSFLKTRSDED